MPEPLLKASIFNRKEILHTLREVRDKNKRGVKQKNR
jgi:hypothetical protein